MQFLNQLQVVFTSYEGVVILRKSNDELSKFSTAALLPGVVDDSP